MLDRAVLAFAFMSLWTVASPAFAHGDDHKERLREGVAALAAREAYATYCAGCHGEHGEGGTGPEAARIDFSAPEALVRLDREAMEAAVANAHPAEVAARWQTALGEDGVAAVVGFVREAFMLPAPVADASTGRRIYARTCSVCHGERGDAASWARNSLYPPPADFSREDPEELSRRAMINTVTYGSPGTAMMPFATQLDRSEIAAVVDYIRDAFLGRAREAKTAHGGGHQHQHAGGDLDAAFPGGLVGDWRRGAIFYERNCAECHGLDGRGEGPRAYFMVRKPRDFTTPKARVDYNRPHLFEGIAKGVVGSEMPAWSKVIGPQTIADVAEYVFQAFIAGNPEVAKKN